MAFRNTIGWFLAGFAAATLAVAAGGAGRAHAQSSFEPITQRADGLLTRPRVQTEASREELRSTLMPERVFDVPDGSNADGGTGTPLGGSRPPVRRAGDGREAPIQQREARPVREDGSFQPEPVARNGDGVFSEPEPAAPKDGEDPTRQDTRSPRDADAFATPQALTDRTLASLAVEPLYDRLTDRLFRFEPYERVGYSFGSFVLFPEVELGALWRSNVLRAPDARQDAALTAVPAIEAISNWNRHAMALRAAGNFSAYRDFESENDRSQQLEARGRIDVTRRTNIEALASRSVAQELRSSIDAAQGGTRSDITTDRLIGAYNTRFNRLSL
ncbi:MAG: hypothetical protein RLZ98_3002, partial [Pseudomonadota bacterium]